MPKQSPTVGQSSHLPKPEAYALKKPVKDALVALQRTLDSLDAHDQMVEELCSLYQEIAKSGEATDRAGGTLGTWILGQKPLGKEGFQALCFCATGGWRSRCSIVSDLLASSGFDIVRNQIDREVATVASVDDPDEERARVVRLLGMLQCLAEDLECETPSTPWAGNQAAAVDAAALEETADGPPQATATNVEKWREVMDSLEQCRLSGERFTSQRKFAERFDCSPFVVNKAIKNGSVELQEWAAKQRSESRLNAAPEVSAATFASTPQARESDPSEIIEADDVDAVMVYLIEQAEKSGPEAVARLQNMTPAERRQLAETAYHDPDLEEQVLRYRRQRKRLD